MHITHEEAEHAFVLRDESGQEIGRLAYRTGGGRLNAMSTFVQLPYRHQGYGAMLLNALVAYARATGRLIVPICSFVQMEFLRHRDRYADVIAPQPAGARV